MVDNGVEWPAPATGPGRPAAAAAWTPAAWCGRLAPPHNSLGLSESNDVRHDLFWSTIDLPGQVKLKVPFPGAGFSSITASLFEVEL